MYTWTSDRKIADGCSRRRPDIIADLGYQVIIIEVDENQHSGYDCSCENKRLMELSKDVDHRPIIFIRFNPDNYIQKDGTVVKTCWGINKQTAVCQIKPSKTLDWTNRLMALKEQVTYWCNPENKTDKTVEVVQLFYDETD
jgi:Holliday junction resolvase